MDEHERRLEQHKGEVRAADHGQHVEPAVEHAAGHSAHAEGGHAAHGARGAHGGHGDHAAQFRDRFWISLVLAVPVVAFSEMFSDLLGYTAPTFPGSTWISPVLGTVLFVYGGRPFLTGAVSEFRSQQPGMMLLVTMAISVAFVASWATSLDLGGFDLDFWWELALLIVIMLLGHWLEMRALGAASGALDALAALLPDAANKVIGAGVVEVPLADLHPGDVVLVRPGERVPADGTVLEGAAESTSR